MFDRISKKFARAFSGPDFNAMTSKDLTAAFEKAVRKNRPKDVAKILATKKVDINLPRIGVDWGFHSSHDYDFVGNALAVAAVFHRNPLLVKELIAGGADVNDSDKFTTRDNGLFDDHSNVLLAAVERQDAAMVKFLINAGADVNKEGLFDHWNTSTPFLRSVGKGNMEIFEMLAAGGGDLASTKDYIKWTALIHAADQGSIPFVTRLLELGADPSQKDSGGRTALDHAAEKGFLDIKNILAGAMEKQAAAAAPPPPVDMSVNQDVALLTSPVFVRKKPALPEKAI